jgi:hypothetical protein
MSQPSLHRTHLGDVASSMPGRDETAKRPGPLAPGATLGLVGALVAAGAYGHQLPAAGSAPIPQAAVADLQHARVEIYCGHNGAAIADIRSAGARLRGHSAPVSAAVFVRLDQAAWLARRDRFEQAEAAIDAALNSLSGGPPVA